MSKREHGQAVSPSEAEGSRTKRRRETAGGSSDVDITLSDPITPEIQSQNEVGGVQIEVVREQGLKLWQTVKDAVNKEGRILSLDFLRKPSKRLYPDYYQLIQRPIALDEIKKQLEHGGYASLDAVKQDFELCFNNAKHYNMKESEIWRDAKDLLKLVNKTYNKLAPTIDDEENVDGDGEKKSKSKAPNLNRLIKSRLQKLVDRTDSQGRILSVEFMELPSKKDWPLYYKEIKRPQCLENIFKRIKRKEYHTSNEFASDVELVFSNAMAFNQEHTGIWEDARSLRDYFRLLMSDLPAPYALPEYTKPSNGKIKIKMPPAAQPSTSVSSAPAPLHSVDALPVSSSILLRVPGTNAAKDLKVSPAASPISSNVSLPAISTATPPAVPPLVLPSTQSTQPLPTASSQPLPNIPYSHYPNASYVHPSTSTGPAAPSTSSPSVNSLQGPSVSHPPAAAPGIHPNHQLRTVTFTTQPNRRIIILDYRDGVKSWAMRLGTGETGLFVGQVTFLGEQEDESSGDEGLDIDIKQEEEEEEEEEEEHMEVDVPTKNGKKKGKGRGRGRPKGTTKAGIAKTKAVALKKKMEKVGPVQLKLNGLVLKEQEDQDGGWVVNLSVGLNIVEVGEVGGLIWKAYIERLDNNV